MKQTRFGESAIKSACKKVSPVNMLRAAPCRCTEGSHHVCRSDKQPGLPVHFRGHQGQENVPVLRLLQRPVARPRFPFYALLDLAPVLERSLGQCSSRVAPKMQTQIDRELKSWGVKSNRSALNVARRDMRWHFAPTAAPFSTFQVLARYSQQLRHSLLINGKNGGGTRCDSSGCF
jgi:hypothetical protein